jgi:hypothetical protein
MGNEIVYCSVCGERISHSDLEKGKAVMLLKKYFCRACAVTVVKESSEGPNYDPTVTPTQIKVRTQRIPLADKPRKSNRIPFWIAAAIGSIALLLLYVILSKHR